MLKIMYTILVDFSHHHFLGKIISEQVHYMYSTGFKSNGELNLPFFKAKWQAPFIYRGMELWNRILSHVRDSYICDCLTVFHFISVHYITNIYLHFMCVGDWVCDLCGPPVRYADCREDQGTSRQLPVWLICGWISVSECVTYSSYEYPTYSSYVCVYTFM